MSKLARGIICLVCMLFITNVHGDEIYYRNKNGVSLTLDQYNLLGELYFDGYQEYVSMATHNKFLSLGYYDKKVEKEVVEDFDDTNVSPQGTWVETTAKKLSLAHICSDDNECTMVTTLHWKGAPKVISYDVIGSYLYGNLTRINTPTTYLYWSGQTTEYKDRVYSGNGFGCTVLLPKSSVLMNIVQDVDVKVNGDGTFYSSYQHATKKISLETSMKYTTGYGGYGGVFFFYGSAVGVYDQMTGVNMHLS